MGDHIETPPCPLYVGQASFSSQLCESLWYILTFYTIEYWYHRPLTQKALLKHLSAVMMYPSKNRYSSLWSIFFIKLNSICDYMSVYRSNFTIGDFYDARILLIQNHRVAVWLIQMTLCYIMRVRNWPYIHPIPTLISKLLRISSHGAVQNEYGTHEI